MEIISAHSVKPPENRLDSFKAFQKPPNWFTADYAARIKPHRTAPIMTHVITSDIPTTCFAMSLSRVCVLEAPFSPDRCLSLSFPLCCYQTNQKHDSSYFVSRWSVCGAHHTRTVQTLPAVVNWLWKSKNWLRRIKFVLNWMSKCIWAPKFNFNDVDCQWNRFLRWNSFVFRVIGRKSIIKRVSIQMTHVI